MKNQDQMKDKIIAFFDFRNGLPGRRQAIFFICIAFAFKLFFFAAHLQSVTPKGALYELRGDALDYVNYAENVYKTGEHFIGDGGQKLLSTRMPGLEFVYLPLRVFFSQHNTLLLIIFIQLVLSALSTYYLALLAYRLFKHIGYFYFTFIVFSISSYVAAYDGTFYTESLSTSLLIFSSYILFTADKEKGLFRFFIAGLMMAMVIFFRPYMGLI
ncbi:MAG: hypothetical protein ACHQIM_20750, partial [Sphingobacteriales bacterium]